MLEQYLIKMVVDLLAMLGNRWRRRRRESGRRQLEHWVRPAGKIISMILCSRSLVTTKQHYLENLSCEGGEVGLGRGACWERGGRLWELGRWGWGWGCEYNNRPNINKHSLVTDWRLVYCKSETSNTHLQRIEGGLRLNGDGEATSSTVSVTVCSLWTETLEQKEHQREKKHFV